MVLTFEWALTLCIGIFLISTIISTKTNPILIMTGKQDACVGYEDAVKVLKSYTRSTFLIVDGAGHNLQIEKETLFHDVVLHFLRNIL